MSINHRKRFFKLIKNSETVGYFPRLTPNPAGDRLIADGNIEIIYEFSMTDAMIGDTKGLRGIYAPKEILTKNELKQLYGFEGDDIVTGILRFARMIDKPISFYEKVGIRFEENINRRGTILYPNGDYLDINGVLKKFEGNLDKILSSSV